MCQRALLLVSFNVFKTTVAPSSGRNLLRSLGHRTQGEDKETWTRGWQTGEFPVWIHVQHTLFFHARVHIFCWCAHRLRWWLSPLVAVITWLMFLGQQVRLRFEVFLGSGPALTASLLFSFIHVSLTCVFVCRSHCLSLSCSSSLFLLDFDFHLVPLLDLFILDTPSFWFKKPSKRVHLLSAYLFYIYSFFLVPVPK